MEENNKDLREIGLGMWTGWLSKGTSEELFVTTEINFRSVSRELISCLAERLLAFERLCSIELVMKECGINLFYDTVFDKGT